MPGQHLPADHSRGDANTIGGYASVHGRPAAFEGNDGYSYSVEIVSAPTGHGERPWGAYLLFVQWGRIGATSDRDGIAATTPMESTRPKSATKRTTDFGVKKVQGDLF